MKNANVIDTHGASFRGMTKTLYWSPRGLFQEGPGLRALIAMFTQIQENSGLALSFNRIVFITSDQDLEEAKKNIKSGDVIHSTCAGTVRGVELAQAAHAKGLKNISYLALHSPNANLLKPLVGCVKNPVYVISDNPQLSSDGARAHTNWIDEAKNAGLDQFMDIMRYEGRKDGLNTREPTTLPRGSAETLNKTYQVGASAVMSPVLEGGVTLYKDVTVGHLKSDSASPDVVVGDIVTDKDNQFAFNISFFTELLCAATNPNPGKVLSFGYPRLGQSYNPLQGTTMKLDQVQPAFVQKLADDLGNNEEGNKYEDEYDKPQGRVHRHQEPEGSRVVPHGHPGGESVSHADPRPLKRSEYQYSRKTGKTLESTFFSAAGIGGMFVVSDIVVGALMAAKVINFSQLNMAAQGGSVAAMVALPVLCIAIAVVCFMIAKNNKKKPLLVEGAFSTGKAGAHFASDAAITYAHSTEYSSVSQEGEEEGQEFDNAGGDTVLGDEDWYDPEFVQMQPPEQGNNQATGASSATERQSGDVSLKIGRGIWAPIPTDVTAVQSKLDNDYDDDSDHDGVDEPNPFA